jgi:hypothetical protein
MKSILSVKKSFLFLILAFTSAIAFAQPTVLYSSVFATNTNTTPNSTNQRFDLNTVGGFKQVRFLANTVPGGTNTWAYHIGTAAAPDYTTCYRPYNGADAAGAISLNNYIQPNTNVNAARCNGGGGVDGNLPTLTAGNYYTFNVTNNSGACGGCIAAPSSGGTCNSMAILETSYNPVTISGFTQAPGTFGSLVVSITTGATPSAGENIFVRYTINGYVNSTIVQATGAGTAWSATIPWQSAAVSYYVYTSNKTLATINADVTTNGQSAHDMATLNLLGGGSWTPLSGPIIVSSAAGSFNPPVSYATLTVAGGAFAALNAAAAGTNAVTILVTADVTTETGATALAASANWTSINMQPSGARTISGSFAGPLIDLNGADNVTFDGLNTGGNSMIIENTLSAATPSTIRFIADATNNTIQNCTIKGATTATTLGTIFFSTGTVTGNDGNSILNNTIVSSGANFATNAIYSAGTSAAIDNSGITVSGNNIADYFNATSVTAGIIITATGNSTWTITNNKLYQTATRIYTAATTHSGIAVLTGSGYTITGNTIGFANSGGTGTTNMEGVTTAGTFAGTFPSSYTLGSATLNATRYIAINCAFTAGGTISNIQNNTIAGFALLTSSGATTTNGIWCGVNITSGNAGVGNLTGNTIGTTSGTSSIYAATTTGGGVVVGIYSTSTGTVLIQQNNIGAIDAVGTTATLSGAFTGIDVAGTGTYDIAFNNIGNATANNIRTGYTLTGGNLSNTGTITSTTGATSPMVGIRHTATGATVSLSLNNLQGWQNGTTGGGATTGITSTGAVTSSATINLNHLGTSSQGWMNWAFANTGGTVTGINLSGAGGATTHSIQNNDFRGITYTVSGTSAHTYITLTGATAANDVATVSSNTFTNLNVNTTGSITFISHNYTMAATGTQTFNNNSIVTGFNKGGAGGTITITTTNGSSVNGSICNITNNNFSNITVTGATTILGINNTDGLSTGTSVKTITGNTFNTWTGGISSITGMNISYFHTGTHSVSSNTLTNITGQGAITGITINSSASSATLLTIGSNTINNLTSTGAGGSVIAITCSNTSPAINISSNTINTLSSTGASAVTGLAVTGATVTNVYKNKIYDLSGTNASTTINGLLVSSGTTVNVYNNLVGDLRATAANAANPLIGLSFTGGTTINAYYNTVYLNGSSSGALFGSSAISVSTTPTVTLRNNIFYNASTTTGAGLAVAYRRSTTTLTSYGANSNNNDFYGSNIYTDGTNTDANITAYRTRVAARDANSFIDNYVPGTFFQSVAGSNANFLKYNIGIALQTESGAVNIATYTDDYLGTIRFGNGGYITCTPASTAPDCGAWELCGIAADLSGPSISYTNLGNTSCLTDRTLSPVTITDPSSVNVTVGTKPRLYFKKSTDANAFAGNTSGNNGWKYVEATNGSSPFSFTTSYSLLQAPIAVGDVIQYFVVAADLASPTANVSINTGTFVGTTPITVDLQAQGVTSIGGTPSSYSILNPGLSGTVTIGAAGTYTTLTTAVTGAFADINTKGLSGNLIINIIDPSITETGATALNAINYNGCAAGPYTVSIKPDVGVTAVLTGSVSTGLITINAADNVTIDGSNNGSSSRNLTITNTNIGTSSAVVWLQNNGADGATSNTIKNCNIVGSGNTQTLFGIGMGSNAIGTGSLGTGNNTNTIQNNNISKTQYGIYTQGASLGNKNTGNIITQNLMNTASPNNISKGGIWLGFENNIQVTANTISGITQASSPDVFGIALGLTAISTSTFTGNEVTNATVSTNYIGTVTNTGTFSAVGISVASATSGINQISNNSIYGVGANGTVGDFGASIFLGGGAGSTTKVYYNSVSMTGTLTGGSYPNICLAIGGSDPTVDARDNILYNTQVNGTGTSYAIATASSTYVNLTSDLNDLFTTSGSGFSVGKTGSLSQGSGTDQTFANWKLVTGKDANSISADPIFNSNINLQPQLLSPVLGAANITGTGITTDILGIVRSVGAPPTGSTIGAYEQAGDFQAPAISYTTLGNTSCLTDRTLNPVTITDASNVNVTVGTKPRLYYKKSTDANTYAGNTAAFNGWKYVEASNGASPFSFTTDYSLLQSAPVGGDVIQYFIVAQDLASTPNVAINSGTFNATPASVALTVTAFPLTGTINSYTLVTTLPTTITIGAAGTYPSLTGATGLFNAINNSTLSGNTTVTILDPVIAETGAVALNQIQSGGCLAASYTLLIKPDVGVTTVLTGTLNNNSLVRILSSNVTIDGSNNGSSTRNMTITNISTTSPSVVLFGSTGTTPVSNSTLKNSIIINGINTASAVLVSDGTTPGNPGYFTNITLQNNAVQLALIGMYCNAAVLAGNGNGLNITGNDLTTSGVNSIRNVGIYVQGADGATVSNNLIGNFDGTSSEDDKGIWFATGTVNSSVFGNTITNLNYTGTGGYGGQGIYVSTGVTGAGIKLYNNMIANLSGDGWNYASIPTDNPVGIVLTGTQTGIEIYYNSINLYGSTLNQSSAMSMGIFLNTGSVATIKDNIISNNLGLLGATGYGTSAIYAATGNAQFTAIDYNDYYVNPTGSGGKYIGQLSATGYATFAGWQGVSGGDANSLNVQPNFNSPTDLHLVAGTNCALDSYGTPIAGITTDYDGQTRDAASPDMGADEFTATYGTTLAGLAGSAVCVNKTVSPAGTTYATSNCSLIANVLPSGGGTAVSGKVNTCVTLDATQQYFNADPYVQRHFDIEPATNASTATATVTLYFTDAEFVLYNTNNPVRPKLPTVAGGGNADPNIANVKITQFHGTPIGGLPTATPGNYTGIRVLINPTSVTYNGSYWSVTFNVTGFSGFYAHSNNWTTPLPISLNYFRGTRQGTNHLLDWKVTCNSTPSVTMMLERSGNSTGPFAGINTQSADAVRCNQPFNYTDAQPLKGMNYYRLKMVDADGKISYSGIVALLNAVKGFEIINVAPNPVTSSGLFKLNVTSAQSTKVDLLITDMMGRVVMRQSNTLFDGYNSIDMNVSTLASGTYTISAVTADEKTRTVRFVKQ